MALVRLIMAGRVFDATTAGQAIEEWSTSISLLTPPAPDVVGRLNSVAATCKTWFQAAGTQIHPTVALETITLNEVDVTTGIQVNDPTVIYEVTQPFRGGGVASRTYPLGTSYKVSLDVGSRDRTTKGGFFVPRTTLEVATSGRFDGTQLAAALTTAKTLIDGLNNDNGGGLDVGVWSRKNNSVTKSTRLRIGNVPDNISRRRRQLEETYTAQTITS